MGSGHEYRFGTLDALMFAILAGAALHPADLYSELVGIVGVMCYARWLLDAWRS